MSAVHFVRIFILWIFIFCVSGCKTTTDSEQKKSDFSVAEKEKTEKKSTEISNSKTDSNIPEKVYTVLNYVRKYNKAPEGFSGGRKFGNFEKRLPLKDSDGVKMKYQEWDVNPKKKGKSRGAERLITSENKRAWYTSDHYESFTEIEN